MCVRMAAAWAAALSSALTREAAGMSALSPVITFCSNTSTGATSILEERFLRFIWTCPVAFSGSTVMTVVAPSSLASACVGMNGAKSVATSTSYAFV